VFGVIGVLIGAYGGVCVRVWLAKKLGRDWPVGVAESAIAVGLALLVASKLHSDVMLEAAQLRMFL
jgi:uncharacterized membrane protein